MSERCEHVADAGELERSRPNLTAFIVCLGCVVVAGAGGRRCCPTYFDRYFAALDAGGTEASELSGDPTGESDRSAQRR